MWGHRSVSGTTTFLILSIFLQQSVTDAFSPGMNSISGMPLSTGRIIPSSVATHSRNDIVLQMSDSNEDSESRLRNLGFSDDEISRSRRKPEKEERKVRVDMVDNVDATTLTAIGFAAIAFNFFVLANMGDGGIGGFVATIINSF